MKTTCEEILYVCKEKACPRCGTELNELTVFSKDGIHADALSIFCQNPNCELSCGLVDENPN